MLLIQNKIHINNTNVTKREIIRINAGISPGFDHDNRKYSIKCLKSKPINTVYVIVQTTMYIGKANATKIIIFFMAQTPFHMLYLIIASAVLILPV